MCRKRTSAYTVSAGAGRRRLAISAAVSAATGASAGADDGGFAPSSRLLSRTMPEIIEIEPVVGIKARVMFKPRGEALRVCLQALGTRAARNFYVLRKRLEMQIVAVAAAI